MTLRIGYKASAEQFAPRELLDYAVQAERVGLDSVMISDHFQPWRHHGGHAPFSLAWLAALGERTERVQIGTSVMTPTFRYNPAVVAQAFGTLGSLYPGRVMLGVGTGEALNEVVVGSVGDDQWPEFKERFARLRESVSLMRAPVDPGARDLRGRLLPHRRRDGLRPPGRSPCRSTSPPAAPSWPGMPAAPVTGSSAPPARARSSTATSCCRPSTRG